MRLIDADELYEKARYLEAQALDYTVKISNDEEKRDEWLKWSAILAERTAFKHDVYDAPTIEPEPRWIPCSERLPEEDGQYLITVKYKPEADYEDIYAEHGEWTDGRWDMFCFGHCGEVEDIIAWMPLPKPYGGVAE